VKKEALEGLKALRSWPPRFDHYGIRCMNASMVKASVHAINCRPSKARPKAVASK